jgi:DNA-directed RNA polymerase subunit beta
MMTVKSDDVVGRVKVYESIVKGKVISQAGIPESFRVLLKEFQALGLDLQVQTQDGEFCDIQDLEVDDDEDEDTVSINEIGKEIPVLDELPEEESEEAAYEEEEDEFESDLDDLEFPEDLEEDGEML